MIFGHSTPMQLNHVLAIGPEDLTTGANTGLYVSMKDCDFCLVLCSTGDIAGNAAAITLTQAQDLAGTGAKALAYTKYYAPGQKLVIGTIVGTFVAAETVTGGSNTAYVIKASSDHIIVSLLTGTTTWTNGGTLTGGTSGATAVITGTGQDEDILVEKTAASTFNSLAIVFKSWMIPVDSSMLDVTNGFDCFKVNWAQAGGSTLGCSHYLMFKNMMTYPGQSAIGAYKIV